MPQNSLTLVIDEQGVYYRVPLCCINEPEEFSCKAGPEKEKPPEIHFKCLKFRQGAHDHTIEVSNWCSVIDLKNKYIVLAKVEGYTGEQLRFFCLGKELKNDQFLYSYDM